MDIYQIRRDNLRRLIDEDFNGDPNAFAAAADKTISQITRHVPVRGGFAKNIGSKLAREFERVAGKPNGWLDQPEFVGVQETGLDYHVWDYELMDFIADAIENRIKETGKTKPYKEIQHDILDIYAQLVDVSEPPTKNNVVLMYDLLEKRKSRDERTAATRRS